METGTAMEPTDDELVAACLGGQKEAFSQLVERYQDAVFNLAYRMSGSHSEAADTAQEAFIRAYRKLSTFRRGHPFRNWILGVCANVTKNRFRSESRRRALEDEHAYAAAVAGHSGSSRILSPREEILERALMRLPEETRTLLVLKYMEALSGEEIAQVLNIGLSAVKMRLLRGREELMGLVAEMEKGTPS